MRGLAQGFREGFRGFHDQLGVERDTLDLHGFTIDQGGSCRITQHSPIGEYST